MSDAAIEQKIQEKGLTAPRVTRDMIIEMIEESIYYHLPESTVTICLLRMKNGFTVVGESACVSPENFDAEVGRHIANQDAMDKCWALFGFQLASELKGIRLTGEQK